MKNSKLCYESVVGPLSKHHQWVLAYDSKNKGTGWSETLKSKRETLARIESECIESDDTDLLIGAIEEALHSSHKRHIEGLTAMFKFAPALKEEVYERIDDWLSDAGLKNVTVEQALINIDAYQVTPLKRIVCFLYVMQLEEDDVIDLIQSINYQPSITRLTEMHAQFLRKSRKEHFAA